MNLDIYLQQAGLKSLGFDPGPIDGIPGPRTALARAQWEATLNPPGHQPLARRIVAQAIKDLQVVETSRNQGPGIEKFWTATNYRDGYKNREPYCAAAVCYWIARAAEDSIIPFALPVTAKAFDFVKWAQANAGKGVAVIDQAADFQPGDIVVFEFSHIGIIEAASPKGTSTFQTIEANTSPNALGNDGGGVYRRDRKRNLIKAVIRITHP